MQRQALDRADPLARVARGGGNVATERVQPFLLRWCRRRLEFLCHRIQALRVAGSDLAQRWILERRQRFAQTCGRRRQRAPRRQQRELVEGAAALPRQRLRPPLRIVLRRRAGGDVQTRARFGGRFREPRQPGMHRGERGRPRVVRGFEIGLQSRERGSMRPALRRRPGCAACRPAVEPRAARVIVSSASASRPGRNVSR